MSFPDHNRVELVNVTDGSKVTVYLRGAHVTSWRTHDDEEHLYNSPKTVYKEGKAIRGGVPLIFPQFSDLGPLPVSHGFLRTAGGWRLAGVRHDGARCVAELAYDMACGPQDTGFEGARAALLYTITFTATHLSLALRVTNTHNSQPLTFGYAFHSYFGVADITKVSVAGLDDGEWLNNLQGRAKCAPEPIHDIHEEVDRIYLNRGNKPVTIGTATRTGAAKQLSISGESLPEIVLWNPWVEKTKGMSDMPEDGYKKFVCVEHGAITEKPTVQPGASWVGTQNIIVSYPTA